MHFRCTGDNNKSKKKKIYLIENGICSNFQVATLIKRRNAMTTNHL